MVEGGEGCDGGGGGGADVVRAGAFGETSNGRSRFPEGMTERKARARARAKAKAKARARAKAKAKARALTQRALRLRRFAT